LWRTNFFDSGDLAMSIAHHFSGGFGRFLAMWRFLSGKL
jgi:hypothetical protein